MGFAGGGALLMTELAAAGGMVRFRLRRGVVEEAAEDVSFEGEGVLSRVIPKLGVDL